MIFFKPRDHAGRCYRCRWSYKPARGTRQVARPPHVW